MKPLKPPDTPRSARRQRGSATLFVSVMLVVLVTLSSVYALRSVLFEQKDSSNHYWTTQAHEVAQSGIEHALAWLDVSYADGIPATFNGPIWGAADAALCPPGFTGVQWQCLALDTSTGLDASTDVIAQHTLQVRILRDITRPNLALLWARASHATNLSQAVVQQVAYIPFGQGGGQQPPLVVNGCIAGTTGTPQICPDQGQGAPCPILASPGAVGTSIKNLRLENLDGVGDISQADKNACLDTGHLNLHGGDIVAPAVPAPAPSCNPQAAWSTVFGSVTKTMVQDWSAAQAAAGLSQTTTPKRTVYWIDSNQPFHDNLGSATEPVTLVFSSAACTPDCPTINGGPEVYGTVYLDTGCDASRANGWGGGTVYGTVAIDSGMSNLNANTQLFFAGNSSRSQPAPLPPGADPTRVQRLGGSWKDWN